MVPFILHGELENSLNVGVADLYVGRAWLSSCIIGAMNLHRGQAYSSSCFARVVELHASLAQLSSCVTRTFMLVKLNCLAMLLELIWVRLNYLPVFLEQQIFMRIMLNYLPISIEQWSFMWVRLNLSSCIIGAANLYMGTFMHVRPNYIPLSLEQRTFYGPSLSDFLFHWSSDIHVANLHVGQAYLYSCFATAVGLHAGQCTFIQAKLIDETLELPVSASEFDKYHYVQSILFCMYPLDIKEGEAAKYALRITLAGSFKYPTEGSLWNRCSNPPRSNWTFMRVRLNYLTVSLEPQNFMQARLNYLSISLERQTFMQLTFLRVRLNYLPILMERRSFIWVRAGTFMRIRLNYLPISLEQQTFIRVRLEYLLVSLKQRTFIEVMLNYLHVSLKQ
ncbi:LOW QUALITY PROTEIN: hypothetical protein Cgig2_022647 [Carnegiea gigantea]|uniref:Uncharacterized protein n=1 Tax=Carnegiea gigantea TaxID=171969 RepID=A0A9Q1GKD8_9CARY|nr:LOW QUALITY PROTEIN: hypothetical protein Cgig2_022647 [Carnegiea gigantea]